MRIPREFEFEESEAILRKEGDRLIVEPVRKGRLLALLGTLEPLSEPFPDVDEDLRPPDAETTRPFGWMKLSHSRGARGLGGRQWSI